MVPGAPKFPSSLPVRPLLRYYRRSGDRSVLEMAVTTLAKLAAGGMYDHVAGGTGFMEDYACLTADCIDLYEATFDTAWLEKARKLQMLAAGLFEDAENGGFFTSPADCRDLIIREKSGHDNATPSGNSVAAADIATVLSSISKWVQKIS